MITVFTIQDEYKRNGCNICKKFTTHLKRKGQNFRCNCGKFLHKNAVTIVVPDRVPASGPRVAPRRASDPGRDSSSPPGH